MAVLEEVCTSELSGDILRDCNENNVAGTETDVLIFLTDDIDKSLCTFSPTNPLLMTNFKLKTGKTGFLFKGVKQTQIARFEAVIKENSENKWKHFFNGNIPNTSAENKLRLSEIGNSNVAVMVQTKFKGIAQKDAFQLLGFNTGMELSEATYSSAENDGAVPFVVSSLDNYEEPKPPYTVLNTDFATTETAFKNKFATAPIGE